MKRNEKRKLIESIIQKQSTAKRTVELASVKKVETKKQMVSKHKKVKPVSKGKLTT